MTVIWAPHALQDRLAIWDHIASDDPVAAARLDQIFSDAADSLAAFPERGRPSLVAHTRELFPAHAYRLVHELRAGEVRILALVHTARRWPPLSPLT